MKKIFYFMLVGVFVLGIPGIFAQSTVDKRRIEEEKRQDLSESELYRTVKRPVELSVKETDSKTYFQKLLSQEVVHISDAMQVLVILLGEDGHLPDLDNQFQFLKKKGIIHPSIQSPSDLDQPLSKGIAAYMFLKALKIKGGIALRLFGPSQRYAFKELVYQGIMYPGYNMYDIMSGPELILTLTHAADFIAESEKK